MKKRAALEAMYSRYPYPSKNAGNNLIYDLAAMAGSIFTIDCLEGKSVLDLGCGSGHRLCGMASMYPETQFVGVDMTAESLNVALELKEKHNLSNVQFIRSAIEDFMTDKKFDVVVSTGVFHHMEQPIEGFKAAYRNLKDDGFALIWLYHSIGERERLNLRDALQILTKKKSGENWFLDIEAMHDLRATLHTHQYGSETALQENGDVDQLAIDVDAFLNPIVNAYDYNGIISMSSEVGFDSNFCCGFNRNNESRLFASCLPKYDAACYLSIEELGIGESLRDAFEKLDYELKINVAEYLWKPNGISVLCTKSTADLAHLATWLRSHQNEV
ncbi:hypothetical protein PE36_03104 [Moritella sp. PE36]|uniref:class I SAM-dependent methyltransferase n=1 Tax=Moritella sp. PE36 TaxID=58051 RepID=UPI0001569896|nr:class I SAM-dependent methyltransferase [Moritella sp. PE36]EDM66667.1 hypothetical protein PE36_03104 [Moritella sp. PE36]